MSVYRDRLERVRSYYDMSHIQNGYALTDLNTWWAGTSHTPETQALYYCFEHIFNSLFNLAVHDVTFTTKYSLIMMLDPAEYWWIATELPVVDLTMQQIINTMFLANPTQVTSFVGLMDAYRQSIWNMPFNAEMWAAVARGFMQWP